jgi:hypothetical protein
MTTSPSKINRAGAKHPNSRGQYQIRLIRFYPRMAFSFVPISAIRMGTTEHSQTTPVSFRCHLVKILECPLSGDFDDGVNDRNGGANQ